MLNSFFSSSVYFGVVLTLICYTIGEYLKRITKKTIVNPILISIVLIITFLLLTNTSYDTYYSSAKYISYFMTPATVCLAIPLYEQFEALKKNFVAVIVGIISGVLTSMTSVFVFALLFHFDHAAYVTFLPKSVTTPIGMAVSEELGGYAAITVVLIVITGLIGNITCEKMLKLFRITDPIARGISIGSASHALGTAKALELGEVEGAMSSLSIVISGVLTVFGAMFFERLI